MPKSKKNKAITGKIKRITISLLVASFFLFPLTTQAKGQREIYLSPEIKTEDIFTSIAVNWDTKSIKSNDYKLNIRFHQKGRWSRWYNLESSIDHSNNSEKARGIDSEARAESFFSTNKSTAYQYTITNYSTQQDLQSILNSIEFTPIHERPVEDKELNLFASLNTDIRDSGVKIISRREWGADESLRVYKKDESTEEEEINEKPSVNKEYEEFKKKYKDEIKIVRKVAYNENGEPLLWPLEYPEKIRKIFIHHTASSKNLDNPKQAIRDIYRWHAVSRGWGDIGYNYVIDQYGNIYEGRYGGEGVVGGHVLRANTGTIGIAVLGNYQEEEIAEKAKISLINLIAEKANLHGIAPLGESSFRGKIMDNIVGHRDYAATACPGERLYARLPEIRAAVYQRMGNVVYAEKTDTDSNNKTKSNYSYGIAIKPSISIVVQKEENFSFTVKLKNTGTATWRQGGIKRIAIIDTQEKVIGILDEIEVAPGQIGTFKIRATAPTTTGNINFKIRPIIGEDQAIDNTSISIPLSVFDEPYKAKVTGITDDRVFRPSETKNVWIQLQNLGGKPWTGYGPSEFQLTQLVPDDVGILRISLFEKEVKPGEYGTIVITMKGPVKEGDYTMFFYTWFDGYGLTENRIHLPIKVSLDPNATIINEEIKKQEIKTPQTTPDLNTYSNKSADLIRVALSFRGDPIISGNGPFDVYEGNNKIASFEKNSKVKINKSENGYELKSDSKAIVSQTPFRFIPGLQTVLRIDNFENHPAWDESLNDNQYRGVLEVYNDDGELIVINELPLETYLRGIGEVSNSAKPEKIKALMVAARTYAKFYTTLDHKFPGKPYDLDDNPEISQKYLGFGLETRSPNITQAIKATEGEVVTYDGKLVKTPYFNQSDGKTKSAEEVWGWTDTPYLKAVPDTYCEANELLGHGVGLSGCGASGMAKAGKNYKEILKFFYQGIEISKIKN